MGESGGSPPDPTGSSFGCFGESSLSRRPVWRGTDPGPGSSEAGVSSRGTSGCRMQEDVASTQGKWRRPLSKRAGMPGKKTGPSPHADPPTAPPAPLPSVEPTTGLHADAHRSLGASGRQEGSRETVEDPAGGSAVRCGVPGACAWVHAPVHTPLEDTATTRLLYGPCLPLRPCPCWHFRARHTLGGRETWDSHRPQFVAWV
ncbi:uncharacterized protein LOC134473579 [Cavia porcellus]|uniref:uncharacterized protein LOC134473579 n=1 Tax=Cavia porcellus TaxID=10141 RepID=UPI002FE1097C